MKRKVISLVVSLALAFTFVLGGCASGDNTEPEPKESGGGAAPEENPSPEEAGAPEEAKIVMVYPCEEPADQDLVVEEINKISREEIGVTIEAIPINFSNYANQLNLMLTSNEQIDLFAVPANLFTQFASAGHLLDMGSLLETEGKGIVEVIGDTYLEAGR